MHYNESSTLWMWVTLPKTCELQAQLECLALIPLSDIHESHNPWKKQAIRLLTYLSSIDALLRLRRFENAVGMGDVAAYKA
jgi:hypothetical protein